MLRECLSLLREIMNPKSPFILLKPYGMEDSQAFFGREPEIETLYRLIYISNLVILYGASGTGKTSLIHCCINTKFDGPDCIPVLVRRHEDFVKSAQIALSQISSLSENTNVGEHLDHVFEVYKRPVLMVFDQFEEVFALSLKSDHGRQPELFELFSIIRENVAKFTSKFVIILREDFLSLLNDYETVFPNLLNYRLRLESMNPAMLDSLLTGMFAKFNIKFTSPETLSRISSNLLQRHGTINLYEVQIYLDRLWKVAYQKSYGEEVLSSTQPEIEITQSIVDEVGTLADVFKYYCMEQQETIAYLLEVESRYVGKLLDILVTDDGNKRSIAKTTFTLNLSRDMTESQTNRCLEMLEEARLVINEDNYYRLANDAIARNVLDRRTAFERKP